MIKKVTEHVLSSSTSAYTSATQHAFLAAAGDGNLSHALLSLWLSQDRIYAAHAYPRFIGRLIAAIPFGIQNTDGTVGASNDRILRTLVGALNNIVREVGFFDTIASEQGWDLDGWKERKGTRDYTAEMARVSSGDGEASLVEGLIFLWAMERVYLDAWNFVASRIRMHQNQDPSPTNTVVRKLVENWTSAEFEEFVDELERLVDDLGAGFVGDAHADLVRKAQRVWDRVVELEKDFWPEVGEETTMWRNPEQEYS